MDNGVVLIYMGESLFHCVNTLCCILSSTRRRANQHCGNGQRRKTLFLLVPPSVSEFDRHLCPASLVALIGAPSGMLTISGVVNGGMVQTRLLRAVCAVIPELRVWFIPPLP